MNVCVARFDLVALVKEGILPTVARRGVEKRRAREEAIGRDENVVGRRRSLMRGYYGRTPGGRGGEDLTHDLGAKVGVGKLGWVGRGGEGRGG